MNSATRSNWPLPAVFAVALVSCGERQRPQAPAPAAAPRVVTVAEATMRPLERIIVVTGSLAAQESSTLSVKVPGRLKLMHVDIGTAVEQGEVVAQVEPRDYELRLQQAAALLAQARAAVGLPLEGEDDQFKPDETSVVRQARAVLEEAAQNRARVLKLADSGIAPPAEVDTVEAAYKVALNRHDAALEEVRSRQA
ncbi:MAG TPA: biotin/lipoyl-binding protein, partial [Methylomirabilota bacterium]|nr:biotin/lipoyl-binding protein [Methylomirabilota bacterium]